MVVEGETPNCRSAREYRESQKEWIKGSCQEYRGVAWDKKHALKCKCGKPYIRHHEARYVVQHAGLL